MVPLRQLSLWLLTTFPFILPLTNAAYIPNELERGALRAAKPRDNNILTAIPPAGQTGCSTELTITKVYVVVPVS
jgi:hypothetical protein